jgi:hypothetical protein
MVRAVWNGRGRLNIQQDLIIFLFVLLHFIVLIITYNITVETSIFYLFFSYIVLLNYYYSFSFYCFTRTPDDDIVIFIIIN